MECVLQGLFLAHGVVKRVAQFIPYHSRSSQLLLGLQSRLMLQDELGETASALRKLWDPPSGRQSARPHASGEPLVHRLIQKLHPGLVSARAMNFHPDCAPCDVSK